MDGCALAREILRYRRRIGITQAELARRTGASARSVKRWEKGFLPQTRHLERLGPALGMTLSERAAFMGAAASLRSRYCHPAPSVVASVRDADHR
jgi:transcriptional regulator with XRE-family HTH domain